MGFRGKNLSGYYNRVANLESEYAREVEEASRSLNDARYSEKEVENIDRGTGYLSLGLASIVSRIRDKKRHKTIYENATAGLKKLQEHDESFSDIELPDFENYYKDKNIHVGETGMTIKDFYNISSYPKYSEFLKLGEVLLDMWGK